MPTPQFTAADVAAARQAIARASGGISYAPNERFATAEDAYWNDATRAALANRDPQLRDQLTAILNPPEYDAGGGLTRGDVSIHNNTGRDMWEYLNGPSANYYNQYLQAIMPYRKSSDAASFMDKATMAGAVATLGMATGGLLGEVLGAAGMTAADAAQLGGMTEGAGTVGGGAGATGAGAGGTAGAVEGAVTSGGPIQLANAGTTMTDVGPGLLEPASTGTNLGGVSIDEFGNVGNGLFEGGPGTPGAAEFGAGANPMNTLTPGQQLLQWLTPTPAGVATTAASTLAQNALGSPADAPSPSGGPSTGNLGGNLNVDEHGTVTGNTQFQGGPGTPGSTDFSTPGALQTLANALGVPVSSLSGLAAPALQLLSSFIGSNAAGNAANTQAGATAAAIAEQRRQYDQNREDLAPWRTAGTTAVGQLSAGTQPGGNLVRPFTLDDFWHDPVTMASYQQGLDQGTKAINRGAPLTAGFDSGSTMRALMRFGTDYTGREAAASHDRFVGDQGTNFNRLASVAGLGQTATTTGVNAGTTTAGNVSNLISAGGNAQGAAQIAQGNALSNGLSSIANWWQSNDMLNRFVPQGGANYNTWRNSGVSA